MNKFQREKFFKRVEAKYSKAQVIDPWAGRPEIPEPEIDNHVISELELLQSVKAVPGVMMFPQSYKVNIPKKSPGIVEPWGPTISFLYGTAPVPMNLRETGNTNVMSQVENQIRSRLGSYVHSIGTEYQGENNTGQSVYEVTITQKN